MEAGGEQEEDDILDAYPAVWRRPQRVGAVLPPHQVTDARFGNTMYSDWGVTYTSAASLSSALHPRVFTWSANLQDAYHLSVFAGCGCAQ
jgi:hypothetical protein